MSHLFSATRIGQLTLDNRIVIAPMCQYSADEGKATSWHRIHLGQLAFSGAGLLILEATAVEPAGRISPGDLGLWDDETENALRGVVEDIRAWSPIRLGIQLVMPDAKHPAPPPGREAISWRSTMVAGRPSPLPPWRFTMAIAPPLN